MNRTFENVLDDCLSQLRAGASVEDCLAQYPEHAADLRPLLAMTAAVHNVPVPRPDPAAFYANRQRMLDAVQAKTAHYQSPRSFLFPWTSRGRFSLGGLLNRPLLRTALAIAVLILALSLGTGRLVTTAADSLPGDTLYPVKRIAENVQYALTFDSADRQRLQAEFAKERQSEVWAVLDARRTSTVEFQGLLEQKNASYWIVGGLRVELSDQTVIDGHPVAGAMVVVQALSPGDGSLRALRLQVEADPGPPPPTSSGTVSPTATSMPLSPTASVTATPQPSRTPWPSPTKEAVTDYTPTPGTTQEPKPTKLPEPTKTLGPEPTDQPEPTGTEEPEPTATERPEPTATERPEPTDEPAPTGTDEPEPTETEEPEPSDEPEPTGTEEPEPTDDEPEPTETDEPEETHTPDPEPTEDD